MSDEPLDTLVHFMITKAQAAAVDEFRLSEGLSSTGDAMRLLVEVGLDTVSAVGNRFWDRGPKDDDPGRR